MDNVRGHFAAFMAFKTKNQCHIIILLFETLQFLFYWNFLMEAKNGHFFSFFSLLKN